MSKLFSPLTVRNCTLKNRIVMSPMCMYSCFNEDGKVTPFHELHYVSRAIGGVGLILIEASAVSERGRISEQDLGLWDESQIDGLKRLVEKIHKYESKAGIQISDAGRKSRLSKSPLAPTSIPFTSESPVPKTLTKAEIDDVVFNFRQAAIRANKAGFDILELHAAHGYLIHQFLSPVSNKREDEYGGSVKNRFRFLEEIIISIREVWTKPLFVRMSGSEYGEGNRISIIADLAIRMKNLGVDLIDCSSGGTHPKSVKFYPGYQVHFSEYIRREADIATAAVGLITSGNNAEMILQNEAADLIFVGRSLLRNPYWSLQAAKDLGHSVEPPIQYERAWRPNVQV